MSAEAARTLSPTTSEVIMGTAHIVHAAEPSHPQIRLEGSGQQVEARLDPTGGLQVGAGDRVLVANVDGSYHVLHLLEPGAPRPLLAAADGCTATTVDGEIELRDPQGRLLIRYADGCAEICAPQRDLMLAAPQGRVRLQAASDVTVEVGRDLQCSAGRTITLGGPTAALDLTPQAIQVRTPTLEVRSRNAQLNSEQASVVARAVTTTAERIALHAERYELTATKLVEQVRDAFRDATGLVQSRFGRVRTMVQGVFSLHSRRSVLVSEQDTSIDGQRILLG